MGIYIKGLTKKDWDNLTIEEIKGKFEVIEIKTPHGRLVDVDALMEEWIWDRERQTKVIELTDVEDIPTVIKEED